MKKTPLKRKTPLKAKTALTTKTQLKSKSNSLQGKSFLQRVEPINPPTKPAKKRYGLVGRGRSTKHIAYHEQLINLGCFACNQLGKKPSSKLCIHHWRGRNKGKEGDASEWLVLCLCWLHHDPTTIEGGCMNAPSVHGNKTQFKEFVGPEIWCIHESFRLVGMTPPWFTDDEWSEYQDMELKEDAICWLHIFEKQNKGFVIY